MILRAFLLFIFSASTHTTFAVECGLFLERENIDQGELVWKALKEERALVNFDLSNLSQLANGCMGVCTAHLWKAMGYSRASNKNWWRLVNRIRDFLGFTTTKMAIRIVEEMGTETSIQDMMRQIRKEFKDLEPFEIKIKTINPLDAKDIFGNENARATTLTMEDFVPTKRSFVIMNGLIIRRDGSAAAGHVHAVEQARGSTLNIIEPSLPYKNIQLKYQGRTTIMGVEGIHFSYVKNPYLSAQEYAWFLPTAVLRVEW